MKKILSLLTDKKMRLAALLVVTVFSFAVSGTLCYFMMSTLSIENNFVPARLNVVIHETFTDQGEDGYVKENVTVENAVIPGYTSEAYIRVKLVPSWRDAYGNVAGVPAALPTDAHPIPGISFTVNSTLAFDYPAGEYYYYKGTLAPGEQTPVLIDRLSVDYSAFTGTVYEGLTFELSVLAEGLHASPGAAEAAWGMEYNGSAWHPVSAP